MVLYHGSAFIIDKPQWGKGKLNNDYGRGFYCTQDIELAKEWACLDNNLGYVNTYGINIDKLKILNLQDGEYTVLNWLALLIKYRGVRMSTPVMRRGAEWLKEYFLVGIESYDAMIGYRADDSYFSFARAFLNNEISYNQLKRVIYLGELGIQIIIKSEKAFESLSYLGYEKVENRIYLRKRMTRDSNARRRYREELEQEDIDGIYMRDIIREEMKNDDIRLR